MVAAMSPIEIDSETSRIRAALVNSGQYSFGEADEKLAASRLSLFLSREAGDTPAWQAALLTSAVTAARSFGAVSLGRQLCLPLLLPHPIQPRSVSDAALPLCGTTAR